MGPDTRLIIICSGLLDSTEFCSQSLENRHLSVIFILMIIIPVTDVLSEHSALTPYVGLCPVALN